FPGPTTPRDFVTLLVTSSAAINDPTPSPDTVSSPAIHEHGLEASVKITPPRHFMVISKPCIHPDCPQRDGFIRGQYESVEFIREIPIKSNKSPPTKSSSTSDLLKLKRFNKVPLSEQAALTRSAQHTLERGGSGDEMLASMGADGHMPLAKDILVQEGRKRGKTISFAESRGIEAKGEEMDNPHDEADDLMEQNPVEWIMVTRSDPGGSVPRFMVERGTPAGIVSDASKFLDWACKKEHPVHHDYGEEALAVDQDVAQQSIHTPALEQYQTNGHLAGLEGVPESTESSMTLTDKNVRDEDGLAPEPAQQSGFVSTLTSAAMAGIESYAPQSVIDRLPGHQQEDTGASGLSKPSQDLPLRGVDNNDSKRSSIESTSDSVSFASAEEGFDDDSSTSPKSIKSITQTTPTATREDRELAKFQQRKKALNEQLARTREKETKDKEELTSKEEERIRKAEEKHARETTKQEQRYQKEVAKLEAKRAKEESKELEKKKKMEDKDEKLKLTRERDAAKAEVESLKREKEMLKEQVGALQRENTALVTKVGKLEVGKKVLGEVKMEIESSGSRSRSGSLRRKKWESGSTLGLEATVLGEGGKGV
ncbi:MAG: hypothetical protein Q9226_008646, partial [Calogaya cf. arnoldii]